MATPPRVRRTDPVPTRTVRLRVGRMLFDVETPVVEGRFVSYLREPSTDAPGLVLTDDGIVYLVHPDGTRTPLTGGGGGPTVGTFGCGMTVGDVLGSIGSLESHGAMIVRAEDEALEGDFSTVLVSPPFVVEDGSNGVVGSPFAFVDFLPTDVDDRFDIIAALYVTDLSGANTLFVDANAHTEEGDSNIQIDWSTGIPNIVGDQLSWNDVDSVFSTVNGNVYVAMLRFSGGWD